MRFIHYILATFALILTACSGEPSVDKNIIGTWVQETPTSMTSRGLQTTTTDTVLRIKKNGVTHLTRNLDILGEGLPADGVKLSIELRGLWEITNDQLKQTQNSALVIPRDSNETSATWADRLQEQASGEHPSFKTIVLADKESNSVMRFRPNWIWNHQPS